MLNSRGMHVWRSLYSSQEVVHPVHSETYDTWRTVCHNPVEEKQIHASDRYLKTCLNYRLNYFALEDVVRRIRFSFRCFKYIFRSVKNFINNSITEWRLLINVNNGLLLDIFSFYYLGSLLCFRGSTDKMFTHTLGLLSKCFVLNHMVFFEPNQHKVYSVDMTVWLLNVMLI